MAKGIKKSDSENTRTARPMSPPADMSAVDDYQIDRLKTFKGSTPMYQTENKYVKVRAPRQTMEPFKKGKGA